MNTPNGLGPLVQRVINNGNIACIGINRTPKSAKRSFGNPCSISFKLKIVSGAARQTLFKTE